jgi:hypothetical protein
LTFIRNEIKIFNLLKETKNNMLLPKKFSPLEP